MGNSVGYKSVDDLKGQPLGSVDRCEVFSVGAETMQAAARYGFEQSDLEILEESALDGGGWQVIGKGRSKKGNGELVRLVVIPGGEPDSPTTEVAYKAIKRFELNITEDLEGVRNRVFANLDEFLVARELRGDGTRPTSFLDVKALEAARLRTGTPEAAWQTLSKYPEMDEVILLPDDRIIVGFLEMWMSHFPYAQSMAPYYATYAMYDGKTGERVWSHSRFDKPERQYQVVASYPHVAYVRIDDSSTKIVCLGLDDGEKQWQRSWSSRRVAFTLNGDATILFAAVWEKSLTVEAIDLSNGKVLWQKEVAADRAPQPFVVENDQLLVGASSLTSFDPATGRIVWTANGAGEIAPPSTLIVLEDGFVVPGRSGTVTRLDLAGNLVWQTPVGNRCGRAAFFEGYVVVAAGDAGGGPRLACLEASTGRQAWSNELPSGLFSALQAHDGRLYFTTVSTAHALDLASGTALFAVPLQGAGATRFSDHLVIYPDHVVVGGERSLRAFDARTGKVAWEYAFLAPNDVVAAKRAELEAFGSRRNAKGEPTFGAARVFLAGEELQSQTADMVAATTQRLQKAYDRTRPLAASWDPEKRAEAVRLRQYAQTQADVGYATADALARINRSLTMTAMTYQTYWAAAQRSVGEPARAANDRLAEAYRLHPRQYLAAVQGDYYVQPYRWERGSGLLVIDMRTGQWCELTTSPGERVPSNYLEAQIAVLSPDEERLITLGMGLDPTRWEIDDSHTVASIRRSLLAYRMADLAMKPPERYPADSATSWRSRRARSAEGYAECSAVTTHQDKATTDVQKILEQIDIEQAVKDALEKSKSGE
jgi:hypothetical protein